MDERFFLAPMSELSHRALRELIEDFRLPGAIPAVSEYYSEMISAGALISGGPYEAWYIDSEPCPDRLVYQLVSGNAEQLEKAASVLDKRTCLGIDINMGCSAPAIIRTGAGAAWLKDKEKAAALAGRLRKAVKHRLSVKLRTGPSDDFDYLAKFCLCLEEEGVELITLHPRTSKEKFKRKARWEYIFRLKEVLKIPVAGNGDIESAKEMLERSLDCGAVMTGRAAVRQPWIFAEAQALKKAQNFVKPCIEKTGLKFLDLLAKYQPAEFFPSRAKRFFSYFCDNLKWGNYLKTLLFRENTRKGMEQAWEKFFREQEAELDASPQ